MKNLVRRIFLASGILLATHAIGGDFAGTYVAVEEPALQLTLQPAVGDRITGMMTQEGLSQPLSARISGRGFAGTIGSGDDAIPFTALVQGESLIVDAGPEGESEWLTFRRIHASADAAPAEAAGPGQRHVVINEQRLSGEELSRVERAYSIHIRDAEYWYDPVLGAWGARGGPTMGFIMPGLKLGGPLQENASGGASRIFVNGRELHAYDVMALQQITGPIAPGRYFITAQGLAGLEGGPPLWDLAAMSAQARGGGSNTWQSRITGASGFSDGTTGAVFLPNGGIVSTGN
jgi:hypothetical protein